MKNTYVENHNFGSFDDSSTINKLTLRNKNDVISYINQIFPVLLDCDVMENLITFENKTYKIKIK